MERLHTTKATADTEEVAAVAESRVTRAECSLQAELREPIIVGAVRKVQASVRSVGWPRGIHPAWVLT